VAENGLPSDSVRGRLWSGLTIPDAP
jgi:hypothetical protein